jgi:hypothetical protein
MYYSECLITVWEKRKVTLIIMLVKIRIMLIILITKGLWNICSSNSTLEALCDAS